MPAEPRVDPAMLREVLATKFAPWVGERGLHLLSVRPHVPRQGRKLVFGEVRISEPPGERAAHATTPCTLL